jgi:hypothetical protein
VLNLLAWKVRIELARYRSSPAMWILPVVGLVLVVVTAWGSQAIFGLLVRDAPNFAALLLVGAYAAVGLFQVLAGIRWGIARLFLTSDIEFLLGTPLAARHVFAIKTFELVAASPVSIAVLAAFTWGYARAHGSWPGTVMALVAPLALAVLAVLPGELATLAIARVFRSPRIQTFVAFIPLLTWVVLAGSAGTFADLAERAAGPSADIAELDTTGRSIAGVLRFLPTSWAAGIARALVASDATALLRDALLLVLAVGVLWVVTLAVFRTTFQTSWTQIAAGPSRIRRTSFLDNLTGSLRGPVRAIALKELKTFGRDIRLLTSTFFPLLLIAWLTYSSVREDGGRPISPVIVLVAVLPNIAATSLLSEKRNLNILKAAPIRGWDVILGKVVAYAVPVALLVALGSVALTVIGSFRIRDGLVLFVFTAWTIGWVMLFDIAVAALWGRFDMERPRIPLPLGLVPPFASMAIAGAQGLLGAWVAVQLGADIGGFDRPVLGLPFAGVAAVSCFIVARIAVAGGRRLETIEPP